MSESEKIRKWINALKRKSFFGVKNISLEKSSEWSLKKGKISHKSKQFFNIIGLRWVSLNGKALEQPFVDQREIGTLGFILRNKGGVNQLLVQAKVEPGNVGVIQLAPTCQATRSNTERIHGGDAPPFSNYFRPKSKNTAYDKLQSEQGTRFFKKRNRNVLTVLSKNIFVPASHQWMNVDGFLSLLREDYLINTDSRSVLVSVPWETLVGRIPFSRFPNGFGFELLGSAGNSSKFLRIGDLKRELKSRRKKIREPKIVSLDKLRNWKIGKYGIQPKRKGKFRVRQIKIRARGREVSVWDQPIVDSSGEGKIKLICGRKEGILHFLFRASAEPGLFNKVELTPAIVVEPGEKHGKKDFRHPRGKIVVECRQSEEGGRFFRDKNLFQIVDIGKTCRAPNGHFWITLKDIRELLDEEGWLTNEARSAVSLLLPWL
jgi:oxidase EvaA